MAEIEIRFGGYQPARSVHSRAARIFGEALTRGLGAGVGFHFTENVTEMGRKATDLLAMTERGELDLCYFSSSYLAKRIPSLGVLDLPFQVSDRKTAYRLLDGALGGTLAEDVAAASGFRVLGYWDNGFRHISNWRHAIRRPEDCEGLTIRTLDNAMYQNVFRSLGFEPVFIDVKDLGAAVAEHRVDAQENPLTNVVNFNLHKTHRFVSLTSHFFGVALVLCNRSRFDHWPENVQSAVREAATAATVAQRRFAAEEDETCLAALTADGVEIMRAEEIDRDAFRAAAAHVIDEARRTLGGDLLQDAARGE